MQFTIDFKQLPTYTYVRTWGKASVEGFAELLDALVASPEWKSGSSQLVDHRELQMEEVSTSDIRKIKDIVQVRSDRLGRGLCAVVISDSLGYGLSRMYGILGGEQIHSELAIFYAIEDALDWLTG